MSRRPLVAGNWKMNGDITMMEQYLADLTPVVAALDDRVDVAVCVPFPLIALATRTSPVTIGAQTCHQNVSGAFTGSVSASLIAECGAKYVIVGHSERRAMNGETDEIVAAQAKAAHDAGLIAILCVGELLSDRDAGHAVAVTTTQLKASLPACATPENTIIAYEPVWAIGTGRSAQPADVAEMHAAIRAELGKTSHDAGAWRILYGGSVKPDTAAELFAIDDVDGGLIGGASLKISDFAPIIKAVI